MVDTLVSQMEKVASRAGAPGLCSGMWTPGPVLCEAPPTEQGPHQVGTVALTAPLGLSSSVSVSRNLILQWERDVYFF